MHPEQRGQGPLVLVGQRVGPFGVGEHVLDHQGVHEDERGLQEMERKNGGFLLVAAVAGQFAALAEEDDVVGAVPALDDVQPFLDLALEVAVAQVAGDEDGLLGFADFQHGLVDGVGSSACSAPSVTPAPGIRAGR
ncbi:hypothetical protein QCN29_00435 [Streptomyces sp. HNM0663]|uniref:Uncharacterized protein n=1 Tax=Streptomyces chengmaiensis TaxID=3040919 RepID=A0ABT6HFD1_9ACTN|nr:hypothetical protein [Streptomyces chengmaiensis]MDH2387276.1 hypothetical protein [Streptomyces chengmaiensis]